MKKPKFFLSQIANGRKQSRLFLQFFWLSCLLFAVVGETRSQEVVQARKVYAHIDKTFDTLSEAAEAAMVKACPPAVAPCFAVSTTETYDPAYSKKDTVWERMYGYYNRNLQQNEYRKVEGYSYPLCPKGYNFDGSFLVEGASYPSARCIKPPPCDDCEVGNPIQVSTGRKIQRELDYLAADGLKFEREYRGNKWISNFDFVGVNLGSAVSHQTRELLLNKLPCILGADVSLISTTFCFKQLNPSAGKTGDLPQDEFVLQRGLGKLVNLGSDGDGGHTADVNDRASKLRDEFGSTTGWKVYNAKDNSTEYFDLMGNLQRIVQHNGGELFFLYSNAETSTIIAPRAGLLISVTNSSGRQIKFQYDDQSRLVSMIDPSDAVTRYYYDEATSISVGGAQTAGNLTSVVYPDGKKRVYWYNEQDKTSGVNLPTMLTGISDENGNRFATYRYNDSGVAISTEHGNGVQKFSFEYFSSDFSTKIVDPLGQVVRYYFTTKLNTTKKSSISREDQGQMQRVYDEFDGQGNRIRAQDYGGATTTYSYDLSRNLETRRTEASGTAAARTTSTIWHPSYRIPVQVDEPLRRTTYTHDAKGNVLSKTEQATSDVNGSQGANASVVGQARTWSYTYNNIGQVLTQTGPRTDVNDTTSYTYDSQGNLTSVTNPAGHITTMSNYNAHGHVGTITDPNGVVTNLTYHVRGWLLSRAVTADGVTETTNYTYDGVGQMIKVVLPDASEIHYTYDDAHRLTKISDHLGNSINYTLDNMGNRIKEEVKDTAGNLTRQMTRVYDALNRLKEVTGGVQ